MYVETNKVFEERQQLLTRIEELEGYKDAVKDQFSELLAKFQNYVEKHENDHAVEKRDFQETIKSQAD